MVFSNVEFNGVVDGESQDPTNSRGRDKLSQPKHALQHRPKKPLGEAAGERRMEGMGDVSVGRVTIEVQLPVPERPWEYLRIPDPEADAVEAVIEEVEHSGDELWYRISFEDGREEDVSNIGSMLNFDS